MFKHKSVECPECHNFSQRHPCEVVEHIPSKRDQRPVWLLRCYYCHKIFSHTPSPGMGKIVRARGVPKEVWRAVHLTMILKYISVVARPHTKEELEAAKQALEADSKRRIQLIGKDSAFIDGVFYTKASRDSGEHALDKG